MNNLAPIVLFVYNRLEHTMQTVEALKKNELADKSELIIYSDAAKNEESQMSIDLVRKYINTINGFKSVTIIERDKNFGLSNSIINGVSNILEKYGKIIVLEDDLIVSKYFLNYMNDALNFYQNEEGVWHISGWNYEIKSKGLDDSFLWRGMNCWGWGTWKSRWIFFEKDVDKILDTFSQRDIDMFSFHGYRDFWEQILGNKTGRLDTWAIFWYATIYNNKGLCLNPINSFVKNIGQDGSGTNSMPVGNLNKKNLNIKKNMQFPKEIIENSKAIKELYIFFKKQKKSLIVRGINKISRKIIKRNLIK